MEQEEEGPDQWIDSFMMEVERDYKEVINNNPDDSACMPLNNDVDDKPVIENPFSSGQDGNETIDLTGDQAVGLISPLVLVCPKPHKFFSP